MHPCRSFIIVISIALSSTGAMAGHGGGGGGGGGARARVVRPTQGNQPESSKDADKLVVLSGQIVKDTSKAEPQYLFTADNGAAYVLKGTSSQITGLTTFGDKRVQIIGKEGDTSGTKYIKIQSVKEAPPKKS